MFSYCCAGIIDQTCQSRIARSLHQLRLQFSDHHIDRAWLCKLASDVEGVVYKYPAPIGDAPSAHREGDRRRGRT